MFSKARVVLSSEIFDIIFIKNVAHRDGQTHGNMVLGLVPRGLESLTFQLRM